MVYRREVNGQAVAFGHQGSTWLNAMTMYDHATGSIWSQPFGSPIMGTLVEADIRLELVPSTMTTWAEWRELYPDTLAYEYEGDGASWIEDTVLDDSSVVVEYFGEHVMYPIDLLGEVGVVADTVGAEETIDVFVVLAGNTWNVFGATVAGEAVDLEVDAESLTVVDRISGTRWDLAHGYGIEGPLAGELLSVLPASTMFTDQFLDYHPDGRTWAP